ncbi:4'-phosphopantetheinyl transferase superfamily protein [Fodinisporobacter ferrooxydans]|uniref:4'-phosphopantetheinyl transferase superfamily protein n=1 Tax=Fodinisporobacter ferrooxydans TaxID=2901836 RepID=A0ABY4CPG2_9BACL|nr:4'-phosphopantetheinyl transferase superfamily protein [Alicyclobacillaceae bacterium MYW30-H2]
MPGVNTYDDSLLIGIDVERIRPIDLNIARRFFSPVEQRDLSMQPDDAKLEYFFDLWTLKESYVKAKGNGLSIPLHSFSIQIHQDSIPAAGVEKEPAFSFQTYPFDFRYKVAVCAQNDSFPETIEFVPWDRLYTEFLRYRL